ncbi:IS3 family transposase [Massilia sp. TS11]|uniref:IS3 family transposase n=1 Tax=Massilia sp. TS11 TaxID=2908003 RepID=UPI001EDB280E|nr:IS3 family transposase [Massilia sp. TS11]
MRYAFIHENAQRFPLALMCRILQVSRSGCYAFQNRPLSLRSREDLALRECIERLHHAHRRAPGIIKTWRLLQAEGHQVGRNRVARLRRLAGLSTQRTQRFRTMRTYQKSEPSAPDLLKRHFEPGAPGRAWVGDMTVIHTRFQGALHLAAFLDVGTRRVTAWATGSAQTADLAISALQKAPALPTGAICHTDQGSPFSSSSFRAFLAQHGMRPSMSRKGNCHDNAVAESFFSTLKNEMSHHQTFDDHASLNAALSDYIDTYYNQQRIHQSLGYRTPAKFESEHRCA